MENLQACRTCLIITNDLINIFHDTINDASLSDIIMTCTGLDLAEYDGLPQYVCINCQRMLILISKFRRMCLLSDSALRKVTTFDNTILEQLQCSRLNNFENIYEYIQFSNNFYALKQETVTNIVEDDCKIEILDTESESKYLMYDSDTPLHFLESPKVYHNRKKKLRKADNESIVECKVDELKVQVSNDNVDDSNSSRDLASPKSMRSNKKVRKKRNAQRDDQIESDNNDVSKKLGMNQKQKKELHICYICGKMTLQLTEHLITHRNVRDWKCDKCEKMFSNRAALRKHQAVHNPCNVHCEKCGRSFPRKHSLARHIRTVHYPTKAFECSVCGKRCENSYNLKVHQMIHSGEKRYKCKQCPEQFTCKIKYREHDMNKHNAKPSKVYKCDVCSSVFLYNFQLLAHQKKTEHKNEQNFSCGDDFDEKFDAEISLKTD